MKRHTSIWKTVPIIGIFSNLSIHGASFNINEALLVASGSPEESSNFIYLGVNFTGQNIKIWIDGKEIFNHTVKTEPSIGLATIIEIVDMNSHSNLKISTNCGSKVKFLINWKKGSIFELDRNSNGFNTYQYKHAPVLD